MTRKAFVEFHDLLKAGHATQRQCSADYERRWTVSKSLWKLIAITLVSVARLSEGSSAQTLGPEGLVDAFVIAWNSHDMKGLERLYTVDADWVTTYDTRDEGRASIVADFREAHEGWAKTSTVSSSKTAVRLLSKDVAVVHFNLGMTLPGNEGSPLGRTMLLVAIRQADDWRIAAGQITKPNCPSE